MAFVAIALLRGCGAGLVALTSSNQQSQIKEMAEEAFEDRTPEQALAFNDDGNLEKQESYSLLLDQLEEYCFEGRKEIALLASTSASQYQKAGIDYSSLDVLDYYLAIAYSSKGKDSCFDIFQEVAEEYRP